MDGRLLPAADRRPRVRPRYPGPVRQGRPPDGRRATRKVEDFVAAGADILTFHVEADTHPHRVLQSSAGDESCVASPQPRDACVARGAAAGRDRAPAHPRCEPWLVGQRSSRRQKGAWRRRENVGGRAIALAVDGGVTRANIGAIASFGPDLIVTGARLRRHRPGRQRTRHARSRQAGAPWNGHLRNHRRRGNVDEGTLDVAACRPRQSGADCRPSSSHIASGAGCGSPSCSRL